MRKQYGSDKIPPPNGDPLKKGVKKENSPVIVVKFFWSLVTVYCSMFTVKTTVQLFGGHNN